ASGRVTSISVVCASFVNCATACLYTLRCGSRPFNGPRQDVPVVFSSKNVDHADGNCNKRRVWPVGAVSNTIVSYCFVYAPFVNSIANSLKAAISTVQAPDNCSSIF